MTTLRLYNTLTRTKEDFVPLDPKNVRMYVCGPTVYDYAHIGNARPAIVFDVLFRLLRHLYGESHVTYVRNITDIDDKINARALELQKSRNAPILDVVHALTNETAKIYQDDMLALGNLPPTHEPRATRHIPQMIAMIQALIDAKHAYPANGHVLFDVSSKADYGKLAKRSVDDMIAGARVDPAPYKKNPMDFVLWKPSDEHTPGWDSPWGFGRPGWHLECSAMSAEYLGETFDIHGGGIDLVFPHHENEVAQSEGAHHGHPFARVWMHNGHLQVEGAKMSKSLGNFVTVHDLLTGWKGEAWSGGALRFTMLKTHYTQPMNWTFEELNRSKYELGKFASAIRGTKDFELSHHRPSQELIESLVEDMNTPEAIRVIRSHASAALGGDLDGGYQLLADLEFLGLIKRDIISAYALDSAARGVLAPDMLAAEQAVQSLRSAIINDDRELIQTMTVELANRNLKAEVDARGHITLVYADGSFVDNAEIMMQIAARETARKAKNFMEADRIRDELDAKGIVLKDSKDGTTWEVKR